ncbi:ATP-dependent DNA helicase PIF1 [Fusarium oxysporum f. sp. conglutinans]|nr:ATP-dependent DNA helicase PIF1 [Fusarium oxysporum f. sp. conglutinans]
MAVPVFDGRLTDEFDEQDEVFIKKNAVLHFALFVPWEKFQGEPADDIPRLWRRFQEQLSDRVRSYVHNITLLRVSVEDARADRKIQGLDQDFEEIVDAHAFGDQREEEDGTRADEENTDSQEYYNAFLGVLTAVRRSEIKDMPVSASGNAAALIGGVTLHSACNIGFEDKTEITRNISEEEKLRWKSKTMLIVDEISQVGGLTLASVDSRLRLYRDDAHRPFGGIPIVIFFGDFFQFDPVRQTSLLLSEPREHSRQRPESLAKHVAAHKLFLQFTTVVMLREQVRTAGCARLRGFLRRLRNGQQTELDFQRLYRRLYNQASQPSFANGLRAVTPLNQDRWDLNMAAIVQWARAQGKHISIFVAKHDTKAGKRLRVEELCDVLRYGDHSQLPTPGLFFYAQGMPVVVTRNQLTGLKLVNGAPFKAVDIFPDLACSTIALASDVTLHLGQCG